MAILKESVQLKRSKNLILIENVPVKERSYVAYFTESRAKTAVITGPFRASCLLEGRDSCGK
jgi:hypothetical protein